MLSLPHRLAEIARAVRDTVASAVDAMLRMVAITRTLAIFLLLLIPVLLLSLFLLAVRAGPFVQVLRLLLLLCLLLLLLLLG